MQRHSLTIGGHRYWLAQDGDIDALKRAATDAARQGGGLINFVVADNTTISALISNGLPVIFEVSEVGADEQASGDVNHPFDQLDYGLPDAF